MKRHYLIPAILGLAMSLFACGSGDTSSESTESSFSSVSSPIVGGKTVTGTDKLSTVAMYHTRDGKKFTFCTGTLISPNYVLTAAHCVSDCNDSGVKALRPYMHIGIGQSDKNFIATYDIKSFHPHPEFSCKNGKIQNDIAIVQLKNPVPSSVTNPALIAPKVMIPTASELEQLRKESKYLIVNVAGFGITAANTNTNGTKREVDLLLVAICPLNEAKSPDCEKYKFPPGFNILTYADSQGVRNSCNGDSGGPNFLVSNSGKEFLYGVTSHGDEDCVAYAGITNIDDYRTFIHGIATDTNADDPETCDNGVDDNGDGRLDCKDPYCFDFELCGSEICYNGIDDTDDGMVDCDDPKCAAEAGCQPEICDNGIDDNKDGKQDCDDPKCAAEASCQPEICDNGIDDNGNGKTDCDDPQCQTAGNCIPEICDNNIDDNGNDKIDCDDPQCQTAGNCVSEICNNNIDDNDDGKADCDDPLCQTSDHCKAEICDNDIDDNDDGKADCDDPQCKDDRACEGTDPKPGDEPKPGDDPKPGDKTEDDTCGNGILDDYEDCDEKAFLDDKTLCHDWQKVYKSGKVTCNSDCTINYDNCSTEPDEETDPDDGTDKKPQDKDDEIDKELDKILKDAGCSQSGQPGNSTVPVAFLILAAAMACLRRRKFI